MSSTDLDLIERYLNRRLTSDEEERLHDRLRNEPALARQIVRLAREEAMLVEWARSVREADAVPTNERALLPFVNKSSLRRYFRPAHAALVAGAMAACFLLTLIAERARELHPRPAPESIAELQESAGDVAIIMPSGKKEAATAGRPLFPGEKVQTGAENSYAVVRTRHEARLHLGSDTLLELLKVTDANHRSDRISIVRGYVQGDITGHVRHHPLLLSTPHADVELAGPKQRFSSWSEPTRTRIDLEEGLAQLVRRVDGETIWMEEGTYVVAAATKMKLEPQPLPMRIEDPLVFEHGEGPVLGMAFHPRGDTLTTGGWRGTVKHWDVDSPSLPTFVFRAHGPNRPKILTLGYSTDGKSLVTGGHDKSLRFWQAATGRKTREVAALPGEVRAMAFAPNQRRVVTIGEFEDKRAVARFWDSRSGKPKPKETLGAGRQRYTCAAFTPDGRRLIIGTKNGTVQCWDVKQRKLIHSIRPHNKEIRALAISRDGRWLATSGKQDQTVQLWDVDALQILELIPERFRRVQALAFSPTDDLLAIASDGFVSLWRLDVAKELATIHADPHQVTALAFSPDGRSLATAGWKKTAKLWDLTDVQEALNDKH